MKCYVLVGSYIEFGEFHSVRSRAGVKWSDTARQKQQEKRMMHKRKAHLSTMMTAERMVDSILTRLVAEVKASTEKALVRTIKQLPIEYSKQRDM